MPRTAFWPNFCTPRYHLPSQFSSAAQYRAAQVVLEKVDQDRQFYHQRRSEPLTDYIARRRQSQLDAGQPWKDENYVVLREDYSELQEKLTEAWDASLRVRTIVQQFIDQMTVEMAQEARRDAGEF